MSRSLIRGTSQILAQSIDNTLFVSNLALPTAQLAEGTLFVKSNGSVAFTADQSMGGFKLTNVADAVANTDAVNLRTAQALVNGVAIKPAVKTVAVANQSLTGLPTIDGITMVANERILLTAQTTASQNGIWLVQSGAWTRPTDFAAASTQKEGIMVLVAAGTIYHDTKWLCITDGVITVDTTPLVWNQDLSGISYTNGSGLSLTGSTFAVKLGTGLTFDGSQNVTLSLSGTSLNNAAGLKIADGTAGQVMLAGAAGAAAFTTISGDVTVSSSGVTTVNHTAGSGFLKYTDNVHNETPTGLINTSNTAFTLANTPTNASLQLFLNGQLLEPGAGNDYTITGTAITMLFAPTTGDKLRAYYTK